MCRECERDQFRNSWSFLGGSVVVFWFEFFGSRFAFLLVAFPPLHVCLFCLSALCVLNSSCMRHWPPPPIKATATSWSAMNIATRKQPGEQEAQEGQPMVTITRNQWKSKGGQEEEDEDIGGHRRTTRGARSSVQPHQCARHCRELQRRKQRKFFSEM